METAQVNNTPPASSSKLATYWKAATSWLAKLFIVIAFVIACAVSLYFLSVVSPTDDQDAAIGIAIILWIVTLVISYLLLYLLRSVILVGILLSPLILLVYFPSHAHKTIDTRTTNNYLLCFNPCNQYAKIDSMQKQLDSMSHTLTVINGKLDSLSIIKTK